MIFHQDAPRRDAKTFGEHIPRFGAVMQHVGNRDDLERLVLKRNSFTIVRLHGDRRVRLHEHIHTCDAMRAHASSHFRSDFAVACAHIEERIGCSCKMYERIGDPLRTWRLNRSAVNLVKRLLKKSHDACL